MSAIPSPFSEVPLKSENVREANDLLKNGILIETSKGVEWLSLADALTTGVGGLNLSVEDFQNVAAQLLSTHQKLESIEGADENLNGSSNEETVDINLSDKAQRFKNKIGLQQKQKQLCSCSSSSSVTLSESTNSDSSSQSVPVVQVKRKGGWPKGRKRKPESDNRAPKAPSTGYVFYLNEKRKLPLFKDIPFHEVTKLLGNEWSKLNLSQKRSYLELAEIDRKRYREELRIYRNSEAYQEYLRRKRIKSLQANGTEESDVDATDEIDDEDNEELYCRSCDQWFTTLHNKKEHLYGRQHFQTIKQLHNLSQVIAEEASCSAVSSDEFSLDPAVVPNHIAQETNPSSVTDAMENFVYTFAEREREILTLQHSLKISVARKKQILKKIQELKLTESILSRSSIQHKDEIELLKKTINTLYEVPSLMVQKHGQSILKRL